ncbi:hypothetical protein BUALT_Bualt08G0084800 [Buddleja alternifolia]|uniref:ATP-dependent DNA helicase n=1 Tax=Buddleja alternifolia TaxID=168488 RepID=A0AAV6XCR7_9LAMI|nr:hypothetical protein BUALT_Bualt08G0084800 [Buddleja alternifolia]
MVTIAPVHTINVQELAGDNDVNQSILTTHNPPHAMNGDETVDNNGPDQLTVPSLYSVPIIQEDPINVMHPVHVDTSSALHNTSHVADRSHLAPLNYNPFVGRAPSTFHHGSTSMIGEVHVDPLVDCNILQRDLPHDPSDSDDETLVPSSIPMENDNACDINLPSTHNIQDASVIPRPTTNRVFARSVLGERNVVCPFCHAIMWLEEKVARSSNINPKFGLCCQSGKVILPLLPHSPEYLDELFRDRVFMENIRSFNSMFCFTSMGGKVDTSVQDGRGPPCFKISGENYHRIGSLLPTPGRMNSFVQLYICDAEIEIRNRLNVLRSNGNNSGIHSSIVESLKTMLDNVNPYVQIFRSARTALQHDSGANLHIRILNSRSNRQYIQPTSNEIAALIVGEDTNAIGCRDIIVCKNDGYLKRISETHPSYTPLQYPLLFPYGTDGWRIGIPYNSSTEQSKEGKVSMREFWAFRFQHRASEGTTLLQGGRLFNQLAVDCYAAIEQLRLNYIKTHQAEMRADLYQGLEDSIVTGDTDASAVGRRIVLPSSFTGGPRNMMQHYQDAIAICRAIGAPDFFITFTCNPNWPEISKELQKLPGQRTEDRPEIMARVFRMKHKQLLKYFKDKKFFGNVLAGIRDTMLTKWFEANKKYPEARTLTYAEFPTAWVWKRDRKEWVKRKQGKCIGRMPFAHANSGEKYYLRMLLYKVRGAQCYEDLRTYNRLVYPTFKQACAARGLLDDDNEWHDALSEASNWASSKKLRDMFSMMLMFSQITDPVNLWEEHWRSMVDDLQYRVRRDLRDSNIHLNDEDLREWGLQEIEYILNKNGKTLEDFPPMPLPSFRSFGHITNRLIREELDYDDTGEQELFRSYFNVSKTLKDLLKGTPTFSSDKPFGGKLCVLGGDFKQILPVVTKGRRESIVAASLHKSELWNQCRVMHLKINMRLIAHDGSTQSLNNLRSFAEWLNNVGEGKTRYATYPELSNRYKDSAYLKERAILAPKNSDVDEINSMMSSMISGEVRQFYSADTLCPGETSEREQTMNPLELLHSIKVAGDTYIMYTLLELLNPCSWRFNIKVRVIRLIDVCPHQYKIRTLKMVYVDLKGFFMQGVAFGVNVNYFIARLTEGSIYNIHGVQVIMADKKYKIVPHRYQVLLGKDAKIEKLLDLSDEFFQYFHQIVRLQDIESHLDLDEQLIDIFGLVVCATRCLSTPDGSSMREIILLDTTMTFVRMVLFGKLATDEGELLLRTIDHNNIVLACGVVVRKLEGPCIYTHGFSRLYINCKTRFTDRLSTWFSEERSPQKLVSLIRASKFTISRSLKISNAKRIIIRDYGHQHDVRISNFIFCKKFRIIARIENIDPDNIWYATCNRCQDGCVSYHGKMVCVGCNDVVNATIRFRVHLSVKDISGVIDLKLLNQQAKFIFRRHAAYFKSLEEKVNGRNLLQDHVNSFKDRAFIFIVPVPPTFARSNVRCTAPPFRENKN